MSPPSAGWEDHRDEDHRLSSGPNLSMWPGKQGLSCSRSKAAGSCERECSSAQQETPTLPIPHLLPAVPPLQDASDFLGENTAGKEGSPPPGSPTGREDRLHPCPSGQPHWGIGTSPQSSTTKGGLGTDRGLDLPAEGEGGRGRSGRTRGLSSPSARSRPSSRPGLLPAAGLPASAAQDCHLVGPTCRTGRGSRTRPQAPTTKGTRMLAVVTPQSFRPLL